MGEVLVDVLEWTRSLGAWGPVWFALIYAAAVVLFIPGSVLTLGAGFAFGLIRGTAAASAGSLLGASAAFLLGRTLARGWVERRIAGRPRIRAIHQAVGREGFKVVLLLRLSPVFPFNLLNYAFGLTRVPFGKHLLASWIGMLPGTVMYVYLGSTARSLAELAAGKLAWNPARQALLWLGLAATAAVAVLLARLGKRAVEDALEEAP